MQYKADPRLLHWHTGRSLIGQQNNKRHHCQIQSHSRDWVFAAVVAPAGENRALTSGGKQLLLTPLRAYARSSPPSQTRLKLPVGPGPRAIASSCMSSSTRASRTNWAAVSRFCASRAGGGPAPTPSSPSTCISRISVNVPRSCTPRRSPGVLERASCG